MGAVLPGPHHPTIPPWLRPIARRRGEVQFGVLEGGPIITGLRATEVAALALLDGSRSAEAAQRSARRAGVPAARWRSLLDLLRRLEVLDDGSPRPSRADDRAGSTATRHVVVDGVGELSDDIAALLRRSGIGRVSHGRPLVDLVVSDPARHDPALVVIVSATALDPQRGDLWLEHDVPHLPVVSSGRRATVGPLVHDRAWPVPLVPRPAPHRPRRGVACPDGPAVRSGPGRRGATGSARAGALPVPARRRQRRTLRDPPAAR